MIRRLAVTAIGLLMIGATRVQGQNPPPERCCKVCRDWCPSEHVWFGDDPGSPSYLYYEDPIASGCVYSPMESCGYSCGQLGGEICGEAAPLLLETALMSEDASVVKSHVVRLRSRLAYDALRRSLLVSGCGGQPNTVIPVRSYSMGAVLLELVVAGQLAPYRLSKVRAASAFHWNVAFDMVKANT